MTYTPAPQRDAESQSISASCLKDAEMSHTNDHRAEPDLRINTQPIKGEK